MTVAQPLSAFIFVFLGFCFGFFFDLYRVLRRLSTPGQLLTATTDLLFWVTYTVWVYIALLRLNSGEVRAFLLFSLAMGAVAYFLWFSRSLRRAWYLVLRRVVSIMARVNVLLNACLDSALRIVLWPYRILYSYLWLPLVNLLCWLLSPFDFLLANLRKWSSTIRQRLLMCLKSISINVAKMLVRIWNSPPTDE